MPVLYDDQAATYDGRAGLKDGLPGKIADQIVELANLTSRDSMLEIGTGTGQIGVELAGRVDRYIGLDQSPGMLDRFRQRARERGLQMVLVQADATRPWPIVIGNDIRVVFGSRSLHHIEPDHLLEEAAKVGHRHGYVLIHGTIRREKDGLREVISREMHENLAKEGYMGHRRGQQWKIKLQEAALAFHAQNLPITTVASWTVNTYPAQALDSWSSKRGLNGIEIPEDVKARVLANTRDWALSMYGSLTECVESIEEYEISGYRFFPSEKG